MVWAAFFIYWNIISRKVKATAETKRKIKGLWFNIFRLFFVLLAVLSFSNISCFPLTIALFPHSPLIQIAGSVIAVAGLVVAIMGRKKLADNWSSNIEIKEGHELVTSGIYGYVRHPIYTGMLFMGLGTWLVSGRFSAFFFFAILTAFMLFKVREEEELMTTYFPNEYPEYKKRVSCIIPHLW